MGKIIVTETSYNLRAKARKALAGRWKPAVIVVLIYSVIIELPTLFFSSVLFYQMKNYMYYLNGDELLMRELINLLQIAYTVLLVGPIIMGFHAFFLYFYRLKSNDTHLLYSGFKMFGKSIGIFLLQTVFIYLWALLLIFPGIIAAYRYSQAYYIMLDNPEKGCLEYINESKRMMYGNKGRLFCMQLSFIGWYLLAVMPAVCVFVIVWSQTFNGAAIPEFDKLSIFIVGVIIWVLSAGSLWVNAYLSTANVAFYEILTGKYKQTKASYNQSERNSHNHSASDNDKVDMGLYTGENDLYRHNTEGNRDGNDEN